MNIHFEICKVRLDINKYDIHTNKNKQYFNCNFIVHNLLSQGVLGC